MPKYNEYPIAVEKQPDILVVGGGVSGLAAAIGAASFGCEVLILEKETQLGGMFCKGWGFPIGGLFGMEDNAPKGTLNDGLASEFYNHICKTQSNPLMQLGRLWVCRSLPKEAVDFFELKIKQAGHICSLKNSILHHVEIENGLIRAVQALSGSTLVSINPRVVIECSGDGAVLSCCPKSVSLYDQKGAALAGVLMRLDHVQTSDTMISIRVPHILTKASQEGLIPRWLCFTTYLPLEKTGEGVLKFSVPPDLSPAEQRIFFEQTLMIAWDLLQHGIPSLAQARIVETSSGLLQRVGLRGRGKYILNKKDVVSARKFDGKGVKCAWPIEYWDCEKGPQYHYLDTGQYFEIPLACLMSKTIDNLFFAGRCISATMSAISAARVMGTCISSGEAAGILAAKRIVMNGAI